MSLRIILKHQPLLLRQSLFNVDRNLARISPLRNSLFYSTGSEKSGEEPESGNPPKQPSESEKTEEKSTSPEKTPEEEKKITKDQEFNEAKDSYLRCLAEMENIRIRARQEIKETTEKAFLRFANEILPIADTLGESLSKIPEDLRADNSDPQLSNLCTGVSMIRDELSKTFHRHGIVEYGNTDAQFNAVLHEVVGQLNVPDKAPGTVVEVVKPGYMYKNQVLRPASVIVVEKSPNKV